MTQRSHTPTRATTDSARSSRQYRIRPDEQASEAVIRAVSSAEDTELRHTPLYEHIDPDALDDLFRPHRNRRHEGTEVQFDYREHTIVVSAETVELR